MSALQCDHDDAHEVYRPAASVMQALSQKGVTQVACGTVCSPLALPVMSSCPCMSIRPNGLSATLIHSVVHVCCFHRPRSHSLDIT